MKVGGRHLDDVAERLPDGAAPTSGPTSPISRLAAMTRRSATTTCRALAAGAAGLSSLLLPSVASTAVLPVAVTKTAGPITAYTADGARAAFAVSVNSPSCKAPLIGVQQVSEVGLGTRRETVLKSYQGCDTGAGPGIGVGTDRWLALSATTAYWLDGVSGANTYASIATARPDIAARFSSAVVATLYATGVGPRTIGTRLGPLVAGGGAVAVNETTTDFASSTGCNAFGNGTGGLATDCAPVVTRNAGLAVTPLPTTSTLFESPKGTTGTILDVAGSRLLVRDGGGALRIVDATTSTSLGSTPASAGALGTDLAVGLRRRSGGGTLTFWNGAGTRTGSCSFLTGGVLGAVAVRGRVVVYATRTGIFAVHVRPGTGSACGAKRLVSVEPGARIVSFALTARAGLSYAANLGSGGTIFRLAPAALRTLGYVV
jgi:hypothetical protein